MVGDKHKVLILGGGFGSIKAALELADFPNFEVTLVSDRPNFRFYPSLYHTATGGSRSASSIPIAEIFAGKKIKLVQDTAKKLDRQNKQIMCSSGKKLAYDSLIVALGTITNYFGIKGLKEFSFGIKTNDEAQKLRDHLHELLFDERKPDLNYVVVGGGPTGVELAGALPGYLRHIMKRHGIKQKNLHVELVEALPRLMPRMPRRYSRAVQNRLYKLGIAVYLNKTVRAETADDLIISGRNIKSHTVVWTAGVINHPFLTDNKFALSPHGRVIVNEIMQSEPDIYVIGDNAETPYSGMAQTALHDGRFVARNLIKACRGKVLDIYQPRRPIYVTPAGPHWAAVQWGKLEIFGLLGWLLRSAADFLAYHDLEPWWKASKHWLAENAAQEDCPICAGRT